MTDLRKAALALANAAEFRITGAGLFASEADIEQLCKEVREALAAQAEPVAIHCPEKRKPGGCQLHNLHCGWPECNKPESSTSQTEQK